ncbi:MAG: glycine zipper domain-containing protein, partial [Planctomycetota bacterium]
IVWITMTTGCRALGPNGAVGGAFGTLAGGLTGAAIGAHEGKSTEGALIGAVTGGTLGSVAGNAIDREVRFGEQRMTQQLQQQQQNALSVAQIIELSRSGLSEAVVLRQIKNQGVLKRPTTDELILLQNEGVNDVIIQAFQTAPLANVIQSNLPEPSRSFIYGESPTQPFIYREWCPPRRRRPRAGLSINF